MKIILKESQFRHLLMEFEYVDALRLEKAALDYYGETSIFKLTGYITPRGHLLDLSGNSGTRAFDHREIGYLIDELGIDLERYKSKEWEYSNSKFLYAAMDMGFIRVMPESNGFDMRVMPTQEQFQILRKLIRILDGYVILDLDNDVSIEFERGTPVDYVINSIKNYYREGIRPQPYQYSYEEDLYETDNNPNQKNKLIVCKNCGWSWLLSDGGKDPYVCHNCWTDNSKYYK